MRQRKKLKFKVNQKNTNRKITHDTGRLKKLTEMVRERRKNNLETNKIIKNRPDTET